MTLTKVKAHTRGVPDPFAPILEAKRASYARKWGMELVGENDDRLSAPVADPTPAPSGMSLERHTSLLKAIAKMMGIN